MAMFLPLLEYVEIGGDIAALTEQSRLWQTLVTVFDIFELQVTLIGLILVLLFMIMSRVVVVYLRQSYTAWLSQEVVHHIRTNLFKRCMSAAYSALDTFKSGYLVNLVTIEGQRAAGNLQSLFALIANAVVVFGYLIVLMWISIPMTILAVFILGGAGLIVNFHVRHTRRLSRQTTNVNQAFSFDLIERLSAFRLIKLTATEEREIVHVEEDSAKVRDHNYWLAKLNARIDLILEPVVVVGGLMILYFSIEVFSLSLAKVGLFTLILLRLLPLSKEVLRSRQTYLATSASIAAVLKNIREMGEVQEERGSNLQFKGLQEGIRFEKVTFTYPGQTSPALERVDFQIPSGKMTALVGPSGAGKTTLVDVIAGLRVPQDGRVLMDGVPLAEYDLSSIRRSIAFVSQEAFVFNDTVKNNLAFARPEATDDEIRGAMDRAMVSEFVAALPQEWDTVLGERGTRLSGGQKQRLSLARALLQGAPILVLDEATSALDSEKEMEIQATIRDLRDKEGMTIVAIAHRLSTIRESDIIVVLDRGKVQEVGPHERLMHSAEWYSRISSLQTGTANATTG
ncbi:MAG: ABC transporter ATP-binding protein [Desulfobacteraceae bacterium]|jgi:subfamily B ATP-binding cassette protein MsbA